MKACDLCGVYHPEGRCKTCADKLRAAAAAYYLEEPTAAGLQLCIPGTERIPPENGKPAQLSLFP